MRTFSRKPGDERRREIAEAAIRLIGTRGISSLTTTALAAEVGLTSGALFRHFTSREAILQEAVRCAALRIERTFPASDLPPLDRLLALVARRVALLSSEPGLAWLLRSDQVFLELPDPAVRKLATLVARSKRFLLTALREGAADGSIRKDIPPEILLVTVIGTVHALIGIPGTHRRVARPSGERHGPVLAALRRLLEG